MATPIAYHPAPYDPHEALRARLQDAPAAHAEALLAAGDLLQALHERGVLELARGAVAGGDAILDTVIDQANTPATIRALRTLLAMLQALTDATAPRDEPVTLWRVLARLRSPDSLRALAAFADITETVGRHLRSMR